VWVGFFAMKLLSVFVKRYQLEATFAPVDPGLMSLTATLYAGPIFSLVGQTKFMVPFHLLLTAFLPLELQNSSVDAAPGLKQTKLR
ncbi:unnamed protein product, partial [Aphanomyces euteiches]